jgi:hypothetical protein
MNRWIWVAICALSGLALLAFGLLVPIHLRAVDASVLQKAGDRPPALIQHGLDLVREDKLGAGQLLLKATPADVPGREQLRAAVNHLAAVHPSLVISGGDASPVMQRLFGSDPEPSKTGFESLAEFVVRLENREVVLEFLQGSTSSAVQELLRCRALTNTVIFSPSMSASGQAFDAAISIAGLLIEENRLTPHLRDSISTLAANANRGTGSQPLEQALLDLMSLGQRFNWGQLAAFTAQVEDSETLRLLAEQARHEGHLPELFTAVELSGQPAAVVKYLMNFNQTGFADLSASLRYGAGGVSELLLRDQQLLATSSFNQKIETLPVVRSVFEFAVACARWTPGLALALKWLAYVTAGFLIAFALHFAQPAVPALELPLQVRGFHFAREILFALGFLVVMLLVTEPFLSQGSQSVEFPLRIHLPSLGGVPSKITQTHPIIMNNLSLLTLLLFFVLQALLYIASLVKLAEIHRQRVPARVKLKLLENEEHLFDAGLYLGFAGTIISLILVSLHVIQPSLMAAYSSTSFGIIFVSIFKIFQLRPARRVLLLEAEAASVDQVAPLAARELATLP